jgi:hypothetical protein
VSFLVGSNGHKENVIVQSEFFVTNNVKKRKEFSMSKIFYRGLLTALLVVAAFAAFPASSFATHSWGNYHWARTSNPFTLKLGDNVTSAWDTYLNEAIADWNASSVLDTAIVTGGSNPKNCRATRGRVEICNSKYGNNGWLGIASIWASGDHIVQGTAKMNDTYFNTSTYNTPAWRRLVMCQEIAHAFGLDHQDEGFNNANLGTCMDYTSDPDGPPSNEHPNSHDFEQLVTIYGHLDATTTVGQTVQSAPGKGKMPPAMADIEISGPGQWGKLIHSSHGGWKETYELDFGGGQKIITHVIWATAEDDSADHEHDHGRR